MAEVKTEQEPSIEEILESIRQIISEDGEADTKPASAAAVAAPAAPSAIPAGIIPMPAEPPAMAAVPLTLSPAQEHASAPMPEPVLDLTEKIAPVPLDLTPKEEPSVTIEMMDTPMTEEVKSDLVSAQTAESVTEALSKLLTTNVAVEKEETGRTGKVTLEDMARDLMKPLIKTWLDQNLPAIIERVVQKEVEKLGRRALDR
jgi:cell pole-organizing protein PopZ